MYQCIEYCDPPTTTLHCEPPLQMPSETLVNQTVFQYPQDSLSRVAGNHWCINRIAQVALRPLPSPFSPPPPLHQPWILFWPPNLWSVGRSLALRGTTDRSTAASREQDRTDRLARPLTPSPPKHHLHREKRRLTREPAGPVWLPSDSSPAEHGRQRSRLGPFVQHNSSPFGGPRGRVCPSATVVDPPIQARQSSDLQR